MTRHARLRAEFSVHHIIVRIINAEFRIASGHERGELKRRLALVEGRGGWRLLAYAIMSNHLHLVARSACRGSAALMQPLLTGFALWLNRAQGRTGPVFAQRHDTYVVDDAEVARVIAYVHNNPVRAGVVQRPEASTWTSHRCYVGVDPEPDWLDVAVGLELCGFDDSGPGRRGFHESVVARLDEPRDPQLSRPAQQAMRRSFRRRLAAPVETSSPLVGPDGVEIALLAGGTTPLRPRWGGDPELVIEAVARRLGVSQTRVRSRARDRATSYARRVCLLTWAEYLSRPVVEMSLALGVSQSAGSQQLALSRAMRRDASGAHLDAEVVAELLLQGVGVVRKAE